MNDEVSAKLRAMIVQYGQRICDEPGRCEALLRDLCGGQHGREVQLLVYLLRAKIPQELLRPTSGLPANVILARLMERARQELMLADEAAQWGVETWAVALGAITLDSVSNVATVAAAQATRRTGANPPPHDLASRSAGFATLGQSPQSTITTALDKTIRPVATIDCGDETPVPGRQPSALRRHTPTLVAAMAGSLLTSGIVIYMTRRPEDLPPPHVIVGKLPHAAHEAVEVPASPPQITATEPTVSTVPAPSNVEPLTLTAPFDAPTARSAQREWANYLGREAEMTNLVGMKLQLIPPGEFTIGSPSDEQGHLKDEIQHRVRLTKPFYLGVYEVTQEEYGRVMGANPSWFSSRGGGNAKVNGVDTSRCPVENVSWPDAVEFCRRLSASDAAGYRLPTEAEWEYACRAGTTTPFHFGSTCNGDEANVDGNDPYGTSRQGRYLQRTTIAGRYAANHFGLYDMHGNVWEWCADRFAHNAQKYYRSSPAVDPSGPELGEYRVLRGGAWGRNPLNCRSACRLYDLPVNRNVSFGFRVVRLP